MKRIGKNETTEINTVKKCFVGLETALYLLFLALDAFSVGGDGVKYLTIVVCLLAAVWSARHGGSRLMAWAMVFTLAADTFLLLLDRWYGAGIALFCVVQGLYLARIRRACGRTLWALRAGLVPAAWVLLNALGMGTALNLLAALYFVNFLVNACQSLTLRSERLFAAGLWLFLLCDVCVGLRNQPSLLPGLAGAAQAAGQRDRIQNRHAAHHMIHEFAGQRMIHFDLVFLFMAARRAQQAVYDFAVAGQQQQTFAVLIQPPHRKDANRIGDVIDHVHRFARVSGAYDAARLI